MQEVSEAPVDETQNWKYNVLELSKVNDDIAVVTLKSELYWVAAFATNPAVLCLLRSLTHFIFYKYK
jgi:hypothetical protein